MLRLIDTTEAHASAAGPGSWNDADMLEVGNGMSAEQDRAHFSMWCMLASPLIAGNDPRAQSATTTAILTNARALAVSQDPLGRQATVVHNATTSQVWAKPLASPKNGLAVAFLNRGASPLTMQLSFADLGPGAADSYDVYDIWADKDLGESTGHFSADVQQIGMYVLTPATAGRA